MDGKQACVLMVSRAAASASRWGVGGGVRARLAAPVCLDAAFSLEDACAVVLPLLQS